MKKKISVCLTLTMLLTGCAGKPAVIQPEGSAPGPEGSGTPEEGAVMTGFSMVTSVSGSKDAAPDGDGAAQADITLVAVTVGEDGVIDACAIDQIQTSIGFGADGQLRELPDEFPTKQERKGSYGMKKVSSIGKEWYEQANAMADYAVGKTVEQLRGIAINEKGAPADADLAASVTIYVGDFLSGIEDAVNNARHLGAKKGDRLSVAAMTTVDDSRSAAAGEDGLAQVYATAAAVTFDGETITSCCLDAGQAAVTFSAEGIITTDVSAPQPTKNQMGEGYGMKQASSIGREWYEQAAAFGAYVTGKTADEVAAIAVDESAKPTEADLVSSVTMGIGDFQALIAKAAGQ